MNNKFDKLTKGLAQSGTRALPPGHPNYSICQAACAGQCLGGY